MVLRIAGHLTAPDLHASFSNPLNASLPFASLGFTHANENLRLIQFPVMTTRSTLTAIRFPPTRNLKSALESVLVQLNV